MITPSSFTESATDKQPPIPLLSKPIPYTAPGHLRAAAYLYGIETVPLEKARVLELGCETAGNILPFALAYPSAQVVGVDLWPENILQGKKVVGSLNAQNVVLHHKLFSEIDVSFGEFDYIIVHDEFTWAPAALRESILRICRENLSPLGIAYISYNTYPGWKAGDTLRDAMQLHNHFATSIDEVVEGAAAMLHPMSDGLAKNNPQASSLEAAVEKIRQHPSYYLSNEFLQAAAASFYFIQFAEVAAQAGLAYVGDAEPQDEIAATYGRNVQLNHSLVTVGQPKLMKQQYLDFSVDRVFRKSLFVHNERSADILNTPDTSRFVSLNWACSLKQATFSSSPGKPSYLSSTGQAFSITDDTAIRICNALENIWPLSASYEYLIAVVQDLETWLRPEKEEHFKNELQRVLETLFKMGALHYSLDPGPYNNAEHAALKPAANIEHFIQSDSNGNGVIRGFNLWHTELNLSLKPSQARVLEAINGQHNTEQLLTITADTQKEKDGNRVTEFAELAEILRTQGALLGSDSAWLDYFKTMLGTELLPSISRLRYLSPYLAHLKRNAEIKPASSSLCSTETKIKVIAKGKPIAQPKLGAVHTINRIQALRRQERFTDAEPIARGLTVNDPGNPIGWLLLGVILGKLGETEQSVSPLFKGFSLQPDNVAICADLSVALQTLKEGRNAESLLRYALQIDPKYLPNWLNLGNLLRGQDKNSLAEICYRNGVSINPNDPSALNNLSAVLGDQGRLNESILYLRKVIHARPDNHMARSNLLFILSQQAELDPSKLYKEHCAFGHQLVKGKNGRTFAFNHTNTRDSQKVLRLGFVSGDLCNHAVSNFIEPIWKSFNKQEFELYVYNNTPIEDTVTTQLQSHVKNWKKVRQLNDQDLAKLINKDNIDILFDLSGHTAHNRLTMFPLKPAPIQISWIGYPGTTGLTAMDYYFVNKHQAPIGMLDDQFTEKLIRIPAVFSFKPLYASPDVNPLPVLTEKVFTFGSFNRISKINATMLETWATILIRIPKSRLLLGHISPEMAQELKDKFQYYGVPTDRLIFQRRTSMGEYLALHHKVDLLLDTFPYNGGTTTLHGLWMGVPTLTLSGDSMPSRTGAAFMGTLNLEDFITHNPAEYIASAIKWSVDTESLAKIRGGLRNRLTNSSLLSSDLAVNSIERALRYAWNLWCSGKASEAFELS